MIKMQRFWTTTTEVGETFLKIIKECFPKNYTKFATKTQLSYHTEQQTTSTKF